MQPEASIRLMGAFGVTLQTARLNIPGRKCQAVLAYLAANQGQDIARETLCGLIWGDRADEQSRASLRQALAVLRKSFGDAADRLLLVSNTTVALRAGAAEVDVSSFRAEMVLGNFAAASAAGTGFFLHGFGPVDPEFDRWAEVERAAIQADMTRCLKALMEMAGSAGDTSQVILLANRLLVQDDLQEEVVRSLMRAQMRQHNYNAALRVYDALRDRLQADLAVRPASETEALAAEIRAARHNAPPAKTAPPPLAPMEARLNRPSIAVLPFRALGTGADAAMLGEGVADEIIIELSRSNEISVVSRQSSFRFTSDKSEASEIGAVLGVRFSLVGTVQSAGERLRLTARLDRCSDGATVWAERFDRSMNEYFDVQTEIARIVTATVAGRIAAADIQAVQMQRPGNLEAYELVLRGLQSFNRHVEQDMQSARQDFRAATRIDPTYARPFGLLAMADIYVEWLFGDVGDVSKALEPALTAVRLDEREIKGHCALGIINMLNSDYGPARQHFETALSFNNNDDLLLVEYGRFVMYDDQPEVGIDSVREAMRLNPFHPNWYWNIIGRCLHSLGRYDEAIVALEKIASPNFWTLLYLAGCHARSGNSEMARRLRGDVLRLRPNLDVATLRRYFPYRNSATKDRLFESFREAGFL